MSSATEEVIADQSLEEWTLLGEDGEEEVEEQVRGTDEVPPSRTSDLSLPQPLSPDGDHAMVAAPGPSSDRGSDMEIIEHDSDEEEELHESVGSFDTLLRGEGSAMDWSFTDGDGALDLSPGPKAYIHHPNNSVNFWLNLSLLVAVTSVVGMGLGNYIGSYVNWPRQAMDGQHQEAHLKHLHQKLDDCLHDKDMLSNSTVLNDIATVAGRDTFAMTTSFSVVPEAVQEIQDADHIIDHRQTVHAEQEIIPLLLEAHTPHSKVQVADKQVIIRKSSDISELHIVCFVHVIDCSSSSHPERQ